MALRNKSLFLYGYVVDVSNQYIDFQNTFGGPVLTATLTNGNFSLTDLLLNIVAAMGAADGTNTYAVTADRTIAGGLQNRIRIQTSGTYLKLLFQTGTHAVASCAPLIGFNSSDYSGATFYVGSSTTGTAFSPLLYGYNWVAPTRNRKLFGAVNVSAAGVKESIVFQLQQFFRVEFRYETETRVDSIWQPFMDWASQQQDLEFTPDITDPSTFYNCTLESTEEDGQGLAWEMKEMLPEFPGLYQTGQLEFRINLIALTFL
jgi:hypothetical protein